MLTITECPFCRSTLPKTNRYRHFPRCQHADSKLYCDHCSKPVRVRDYPRHRMSCGSKRMECKLCGKAISKSNMNRHFKRMHGIHGHNSTESAKRSSSVAEGVTRGNPFWFDDYIDTLQTSALVCSKEIHSISTALIILRSQLVKRGLATTKLLPGGCTFQLDSHLDTLQTGVLACSDNVRGVSTALATLSSDSVRQVLAR